jgi:pimeloyl-ACP methyl ester carboxylesterase
MTRKSTRTVLTIAVCAALAAVVGASSEAMLRARTARELPAPGRLVDIGGRRIQLDCRGTGIPTVVLESGLDALGALSWSAVQDSIATTTRVCAYTRAGLLWSDAAVAPFSTVGAASDLHVALQNADEHAPFVLVGHSIGGLYSVKYAELYGPDVAGVVLVDSSHPDQVERLGNATGVSMEAPTGTVSLGARIAWTGILRFADLDGAPPSAPPAVHQTVAAYMPTSLPALASEAEALPTTFASMRQGPRLGSRPLIVLTAMAEMSPTELQAMSMTPEQGRRKLAAWITLQNELATWSTESRHELVRDSAHYIQFDRPEVVVRAVRDVVDSARARERFHAGKG